MRHEAQLFLKATSRQKDEPKQVVVIVVVVIVAVNVTRIALPAVYRNANCSVQKTKKC